MVSSRFPLVAAAAAAMLAAAPALAAPQTPAWGDPDAEAALFEAEFDRALQEADTAFDALHGDKAPFVQLAHAGQLSPKDRCHKHKAAGERHWHKADSSERGGPCIKDGGETYRLTDHAICSGPRIELVRAGERWNGNYKSVAMALKDCIIALPDPGGR